MLRELRIKRGERHYLIKMITRSELMSMKLKGKPKCPLCNNPLTYVYEGAKGFTSQKCHRCKQEFLVDTETLEVRQIIKAG